VWSGNVALPELQYRTPDQLRTFQRRLLERLTALPGVERASLSSALPIFGYFNNINVLVERQPVPPRGQEPLIEQAMVSPDFFAVLGIPLQTGRLFPDSLRETDPAVVIVNESTARRFWPGEDAVGKRLKGLGENDWLEVIGVVGDVRFPGYPPDPATRLQLYRPLVQRPGHYLHVALRSRVEPAALSAAVRRAIAGIDPDLPVQQPETVRARLAKAAANFDLVNQLLVCSAALGLFLSALGVYGVVAALTLQRTREIGIRLALGATRGDVLQLVLRAGVRLAVLGTVFGLAGAVALGRVFRAGMPSLAGNETGTTVLVTLALAAIALVACYLPARRAMKVDPIIALRAE
jgi:predicted permease